MPIAQASGLKAGMRLSDTVVKSRSAWMALFDNRGTEFAWSAVRAIVTDHRAQSGFAPSRVTSTNCKPMSIWQNGVLADGSARLLLLLGGLKRMQGPASNEVKPDASQIAAAAVKQVSHIATLPEVTMGIIELVEDPKSSAQDLNRLIGNDPALSARILKVVNSAFYGLPRQIGSINRAISLLGLNAVKNIAIAASLAKLFRGGALSDRFDAKDLWTHSITVAAAGKVLAREARMSSGDEAFLAGLIHDIGVMVELQSDRVKLTQVFNNMQFGADGEPLIDFRLAERDAFGADHCHFGEALCDAWKFPRSLGLVCGHHHDPAGLPHDQRQLPWIIYLAERLVVGNGGFTCDLYPREIPEAALEAARLTASQLEACRELIAISLDEAEGLLAG